MASLLFKLLSKKRRDYPRPELSQGETIIAEDRAVFVRGRGGGRADPIILTNRRLIWYEDAEVIWPLKRITGQVRLSNIRKVGTNGLIGSIFGGRSVKIWTVRSKTHQFGTFRSPIKLWETALREAVEQARGAEDQRCPT
jgi:hypothetical protein